MKYARTLWINGPVLTLEASRSNMTEIFHGGYGHRFAAVSRFGSSNGIYPIFAIGEGDNDDDGIVAVCEALALRCEKRDAAGLAGGDRFDVPADFSHDPYDSPLSQRWNDESMLIDWDTDLALVAL